MLCRIMVHTKLVKLWALSDLHIGYSQNREAVAAMPSFSEDWLILAGDIGETPEQLEWVLDSLGSRFRQLIWVPGNHELYTLPNDKIGLKGEARYQFYVELCQRKGVITPEDDYVLWPGDPGRVRIVPVFLGYDYSFGPDAMTPTQVKDWAAADGIVATDERFLFSEPYLTREAWCQERVTATLKRFEQISSDEQWVLINHYPLRRDLVRLFRIPRYAPWCGTRLTEGWSRDFPLRVVVSGHLHMRATDWRDGVRFEEVSIGYPNHWVVAKGMAHYLREILPGPPTKPARNEGPYWHR